MSGFSRCESPSSSSFSRHPHQTHIHAGKSWWCRLWGIIFFRQSHASFESTHQCTISQLLGHLMITARKVAAELNLTKGYRLGNFLCSLLLQWITLFLFSLAATQSSTMEKMAVSLFFTCTFTWWVADSWDGLLVKLKLGSLNLYCTKFFVTMMYRSIHFFSEMHCNSIKISFTDEIHSDVSLNLDLERNQGWFEGSYPHPPKRWFINKLLLQL